MNFGQYMDKQIKVTFHDGETYTGVAVDFSSSFDNPDGVATICVGGDYEFREDEIRNIEIITPATTIPTSQRTAI